MKLFQPKAPEPAPEGAALHFQFAAQTDKPPATGLELSAAVYRVGTELQRLREAVRIGKGPRSIRVLDREIALTQSRKDEAAATRDLLQARLRAALVTPQDYQAAYAAWDQLRNAWIALNAEKQRRADADAAQAEIDRILGMLQ